MLFDSLNKNVASSSFNSFTYTTTTINNNNNLIIQQQQTPIVALINFRLLLPLLPFPLLLLAFLIVLPGIREQRYISLLAIGSQLCIGTLLAGSITLPFWKLSEADILVHLQPFSKQRHLIHIGVNVGLSALNISLDYLKPFDGRLPLPRSLISLHLNEQFDLTGISSMKAELRKAYEEGQPFPVLCVLEYFSLGQDSFSWGLQFRKAGYYTKALLWFTFGCWLAQCVLLPLLPHYFAKTGILIGFLILLSNMIYVFFAPNDLHIAFPSPNGSTNFTQFRFGICFWMSVFAGFLSLFFGSLFSLLQFFQLYTLSTFLDCSLDETICPKKYRFGGGKGGEIEQIKNQQLITKPLTALDNKSSLKSPTKSINSIKYSNSCSKLSVSSSVSCLSIASSFGSSIIVEDDLIMKKQNKYFDEKNDIEIERDIILSRHQINQNEHKEEEKNV